MKRRYFGGDQGSPGQRGSCILQRTTAPCSGQRAAACVQNAVTRRGHAWSVVASSIQLARRRSPDALVVVGDRRDGDRRAAGSVVDPAAARARRSGVLRGRWSSIADDCFVRPDIAVLTIELATKARQPLPRGAIALPRTRSSLVCLADDSLRDDRTVGAGLRASRAPNSTWTPRDRRQADSARLFARLGRRCGQMALDATVRHQPDQCHEDIHR